MIRIAHLADIHIESHRRAEYAAIFAKLYESLRAEKPTLIVVVGDIFDEKRAATALNLQDVSGFLVSLANIAPLVLIPGNHDVNCRQPGSLDLLTPLLAHHNELQPPRCTFWRDSGVYEAHGIVWTVVATDAPQVLSADAEEAFVAEKGLEQAPRICLFHEVVGGALLSNGTVIQSEEKAPKLAKNGFGRYDLALGGHIHLRQRFAPRAAYCGSLVQQDLGESHNGHGYLLWELAPGGEPPYRTTLERVQGIDILNPVGFIRIELNGAGQNTTPEPYPTTPARWELIHDITTPSEAVAEHLEVFTTRFGRPPIAIRQRGLAARDISAQAANDPAMAMVAAQDASYALAAHADIIRGLLEGSPHTNAVIEMHAARYKEKGDPQNPAKFRLLRFEFHNMFAYGSPNVIDFTKLEGCVSGIIGANHTGKSSLINALFFALYEGHATTKSIKDVIHEGAPSCHMVLDFELGGKLGRIEKGFVRSKAAAGESKYRFYYADKDLTAGGVTDTLDVIRNHIGSGASAQTSCIQLQDEAVVGFIYATPTERKKIMGAALALGRYDDLYKEVEVDFKVAKAAVKRCADEYKKVPAPSLRAALEAAQEQAEIEEASASDFTSELAALNSELQHAMEARGEAAGELRTRGGSAAVTAEQCAVQVAAWERIGGPEAGAPPVRLDIEAWRPPAAEAPAAEQAQRSLEALEVIEGKLKSLPRAAATPPIAAESVARARAALAAVQQRAGPSPPAFPRPPAKPQDGIEKSGPRPTAAEVDAAAAVLAEAPPGTANWDQVEHQRLATAIEHLAAKCPPGTDTVETCERRDSDATEVLNAAKAALGVLPRPKACADGPLPTEDVKELEAQARQHREWRAAVAHMAIIKSRHQPRPGCPGCEHTTQLLTATDADTAVAAAEHRLQLAQNEAWKLASANVDRATQSKADAAGALAAARDRHRLVLARAKLSALEAAKLVHEHKLRHQAADDVIARDRYWAARDWAAWQQYDAARETEAETNSRDRLAAEADLQETLKVERDTIGWCELAVEHKRAEAVASAAGAKLHDIQTAMARAAGALAWWRAAQGAVMAAAKLAAADQSIATHRKAIVEVEQQLTAANKSAAAHRGKAAQLGFDLKAEETRAGEHAAAVAKQEVLDAYRRVLNPTKGIADYLLEQVRLAYQRRVSEALRELGAEFEVEIREDYSAWARLARGSWISASSTSGYQKFAMSLAMRLAVWRLMRTPRPDAFIIDEGFGSCDEANLAKIASALTALAAAPDGPRLVFVVSHISYLKDRLEQALEIEVGPAGNRVANAEPRTAVITASAASAASAVPEAKEPTKSKRTRTKQTAEAAEPVAPSAEMIEDPADPAKWYCTVCKVSLEKARTTSAKHILTKKHLTTMTKAQRP